MDNKKLTKLITIAVIAIFALIILFQSFYIVREDQYMCVIRFGEIVYVRQEAGIFPKIPFIDTTLAFPRYVLNYSISESDLFTRDQRAMFADSYVIWRVTDARRFFQTLGSAGNTAIAELRIRDIVQSELRNLVGTMPQNAIISLAVTTEQDESVYISNAEEIPGETVTAEEAALARLQLNQDLVELIRTEVEKHDYGFEIIDVKIKRFDLPPENERSVYDRMISARNEEAALAREEGRMRANIKRAEVDREANIIISNAAARAEEIRSEGEARFMEILREAYDTDSKRDFFTFMRGLDAARASLQGEDNTIILDANSDLARILRRP